MFLLDTNPCIVYLNGRSSALRECIASIAITNNLTLITHNTGEFGRIAGLVVQDWEIKAGTSP
jgi:predicted nucleic acid-binding protein